ncbi:MAG: hypothetical protein K9N46_10555 [Candidatus Marinimicrobia bacterium]|nr:hypothetical protein [Candidatus Neomarinimicrobiota bacterium]MCF7829180.1 hypothetical protein [Candidatus Neomarinimicrobiota bacterium]MCF7881167.1 hypothetical protein [Candidatus Neomarinimicrobiota bacterium]
MRIIIKFLIITLLPLTLLYAHGVEYSTFEGGTGIGVTYNDGTPFSYSEVKIYRPGDEGTVYQEGLTDQYGRFIFAPDTSGQWTFEISDGMGHGLIETISVSESLQLNEINRKGLNRWQQVLVGVSVIFGLTGIGFYYAAKKTKFTG